jgi:hypothetical protein
MGAMPRKILRFEPIAPTPGTPLERYYSPQEIAKMFNLSDETVRREFHDFPGVLKIGQGRLSRKGRPRVTLRIPESIPQKYIAQRSTGFGDKR